MYIISHLYYIVAVIWQFASPRSAFAALGVRRAWQCSSFFEANVGSSGFNNTCHDLMGVLNVLQVMICFQNHLTKRNESLELRKDVLRRNIPIQDATSHGGITLKWKYPMMIIIFVSNILVVLYQEYVVSCCFVTPKYLRFLNLK